MDYFFRPSITPFVKRLGNSALSFLLVLGALFQVPTVVSAEAFTVTFNANGGSGTMDPQTADVPAALTVNAFTLTGYSFSGWNTVANGSGTAYADGAEYAFDANVTLYAQWSTNSYTVTFDNNGGTAVDPTTRSLAFGAKDTAPVTLPTYAGHTLSGWNTAANGSGTAWDFATSTMGAGDMTLYAQWSTNSYTVTFNSNGGTSVTPQTVAHGGLVTAPVAPTRTSYTFDGWFKEIALTTAWNFTTDTVTGATTLYAKWTASGGGGGGGGGGFGSQLVGIGLAGTSPWMDGNGKAITAGTVATPDGTLTLNIPIGTFVWNAAGAAQPFLSAVPLTDPPASPDKNILVFAYEMGPTGVTFNPAISMTFKYTDAQVPPGTREVDLVIAWWNGSQWVMLTGVVDTEANTVTASVSHFTTFALFAPAPPPPPPPTLKINTPAAGASFEAGTVSVSISAGNLKLISGQSANIPGEGRAIYYLDVSIPTAPGQSALTAPGTYVESALTSYTWNNLAPGTHTIGVQLVQNDRTPFNPPVYASVSVTIAQPPPPPTTTAAVPIPTATVGPTPEPGSNLTTILIVSVVVALALGGFLYWRLRRPVGLKYTNR